ncbi:site-specific integrase [Lysinibacillus irui]|uniref:Site-specific integrase n=1 Tax=Lysinibacillus irui TaxID=2998077 RepID=A0ABU5NRK1_9BACI|nr:site-specific integrase [Lysinibacillus irui]MEA0554617.1 site-specific integrase [Lysinibacillus irui]MEA0978663.1 site-specific integrase [Lysinibacillus irui]MEA1044817.1 site-specific integrase [Lysinibacillus irui]
MASIVKRGENSYRFTVYLPKDAKGRYPRETKTITIEEKMTPKQLKEFLDREYLKFKNEVLSGNYVKVEKILFKDFAEQWEKDFASTLALTTYGNHQRKLELHINPIIGHMPMDQINAFHLMSVVRDMKRYDGKDEPVTYHSKQDVYRTLKSIFKYAVKWNVLSNNPMDGVEKPRPSDTDDVDKEMQIYEEDEIETLMYMLQSEPELWRMMFTLALAAGLRKGELLGLEWKDVDFENQQIYIHQSIVLTKQGPHIKATKTKKSKRYVTLPESVMEELKAYRIHWAKEKLKKGGKWIEQDREWLFHSFDGTHLYPTSPSKHWKNFIDGHNFKYIRLHDLRHTSASLLIAQGVHAKIISERLGHADISVTMNTYGHAFKSADRAAADKLDNFFKVKKQS